MKKPVMGFPTQKAAMDHARAIWSSHDPEAEFADDWLSDLFATRHYYCVVARIRPVLFCRRWHSDYGTEDQSLLPRPDGRYEWRSLSWTRAVRGVTIEDKFRACFRDLAKPFMQSAKEASPLCERCGIAASVDAHHAEPTFVDIFSRCMSLVTQADMDWIIDHHWDEGAEDWWPLPAEHPAAVLAIEIHESAKLIAVCKQCHKTLHTKDNQ